MPASFASKLVLALAAAAAGASVGHAKASPFAAAFATGGALPATHATVAYRGPDGRPHRLEIWRDGDRRLRRDTDGRLTTIVTHRPGDDAYRLDMFDHARRLHTVIDRDSLYRVGHFTDWSDLAYGLRHPADTYTVKAVAAPKGMQAAEACRWQELAQPKRRLRICWSEAAALPLLIVDDKGVVEWRVTAIDHRPAPSVYRPNPVGYALVDASEEIQRD